ncbi:hypothetical protein [Rhodococcus marinonascens]|uniref:hypothetical protein n=1 Tax=Rhodococcus marinonascens TaxID=38311 RepID=UPI000AFBDC7C|nr:hypothetical protein [Rhodococcus marinonascens]
MMPNRREVADYLAALTDEEFRALTTSARGSTPPKALRQKPFQLAGLSHHPDRQETHP